MLRRAGAGRGGWRRAALCLLAAGVAGTVAAPADAYVLIGQRWPGTTIRYHNLAPSYAWSLQQAAQAWNTSGTRLRFVKASRSRAHVTVRAFGSAASEPCWGYATGGYVPPRAGGGRVSISRGCDRFTAANVLAHELGHVLGLGHERRRCAAMNASGYQRCGISWPDDVAQWRCRLLEADDVRGAVRRYGGRAKPITAPHFCWKYPPPPPPTQVTATSNPPSGADVLLRWKNTSSAALSRVEVARGRDTCPASLAEGDDIWFESADTGTIQTLEDVGYHSLPTGRYCYTLWSYDAADRTGGPTMVWIDHVDGFLPPSNFRALASPAPGVFARLEWTSPTHPRTDFVVIARKAGVCPSDPDDDGVWLDSLPAGPPGTPGSWEEAANPGPGAWCYAIWSLDLDSDQLSRTAATDFLD